MSGAALKALRTHLVAAKTALTAGDLSAARASCSEALSVDGESYDAWTFDGKVAFAQGDVTGALASYRRATDIRDDHPAAWQGIAEASDVSGDHALCSTALKTLLKMPADDKAVTEDKRGEWRRRLPVALTQANAWADASDAWTELSESGGDDTAVNASRRKAAECALSANDENARAAASVAAAEARRTSVTSASELASIEAAAVRAYDAVPDPRLERALRSFLESSACVESSESSTEYVPALHGRLLTRARARTEATGTAADALAAIEEAEAAIARHSRHSPPPRELTEACRAAALESACALDLGLDAEEEGWTDPGTNDAPTTSVVTPRSSHGAGIRTSAGWTPTFESNDHNEVIVAAWLAARSRWTKRASRAPRRVQPRAPRYYPPAASPRSRTRSWRMSARRNQSHRPVWSRPPRPRLRRPWPRRRRPTRSAPGRLLSGGAPRARRRTWPATQTPR